MNILPKKRWHVRTRDNIARVRRDEAAAAEEEKKKQQRVLLAEKEARTELLRTKARERFPVVKPEADDSGRVKPENAVIVEKDKNEEEVSLIGRNGHVNLFYELESTEVVSDRKNADHEREAKEEREKEEMKIGYLTYLGQDTHELTGEVSWYNKLPTRRVPSPAPAEHEVTAPTLSAPAPAFVNIPSLTPMLPSSSHHSKKKKAKKRKKERKERKILKLAKKILKKKLKRKKRSKVRRSSSSESDSGTGDSESERVQIQEREKNENIEKLRSERLHREQVERQRAAAHLARLRGEPSAASSPSSPPPATQLRKYNSQFNPDIARQNLPT